jgi:hypothetical protein
MLGRLNSSAAAQAPRPPAPCTATSRHSPLSPPPAGPRGGQQQQGGAAPPPPARTPRSASKQPIRGQAPINRFFLPTTNSHDGHSRDSDLASPGAQRHHQQQQASGAPASLAGATVEAARGGGGGLFGAHAERAAPNQQQRDAEDRRQRQEQDKLRQRLRQQEQEAGELLRRQEEFRQREAELASQLEAQRSAAADAAHKLEAAEQELARMRCGPEADAGLGTRGAAGCRRMQPRAAAPTPCQPCPDPPAPQTFPTDRAEAAERDEAARAALASLARGLASKEGALSRLQLASGAARLGTLSVARSGPMGFAEVWEDGQAFQDIARRAAALQQQREEVEAARKVGLDTRGAGAEAGTTGRLLHFRGRRDPCLTASTPAAPPGARRSSGGCRRRPRRPAPPPTRPLRAATTAAAAAAALGPVAAPAVRPTSHRWSM